MSNALAIDLTSRSNTWVILWIHANMTKCLRCVTWVVKFTFPTMLNAESVCLRNHIEKDVPRYVNSSYLFLSNVLASTVILFRWKTTYCLHRLMIKNRLTIHPTHSCYDASADTKPTSYASDHVLPVSENRLSNPRKPNTDRVSRSKTSKVNLVFLRLDELVYFSVKSIRFQ